MKKIIKILETLSIMLQAIQLILLSFILVLIGIIGAPSVEFLTYLDSKKRLKPLKKIFLNIVKLEMNFAYYIGKWSLKVLQEIPVETDLTARQKAEMIVWLAQFPAVYRSLVE